MRFNKIQKVFVSFLFLVSSFILISAAPLSLNCEFRANSCLADEFDAKIYANDGDGNGDNILLNSVLSLNADSNYNYRLCCSSPYPDPQLNFVTSTTTNSGSACSGLQSLIYFNSNVNSVVSLLYNSSYSTHILCGGARFGNLNMPIVKTEADYNKYANIGYSCMFRISGEENGKISSCDATFGASNNKKYPIAVMGRIWENSDSLKCNSDCTSKFDGRVYLGCASKVSACSVLNDYPELAANCDGALLGSWVSFNETHEGKCQAPWTERREKVFTSSKLDVKANKDQCLNLINRKYQVVVDNELVTMNIYICSD